MADSARFEKAMNRVEQQSKEFEQKIDLWEKVFTAESESTTQLSNILATAGMILTIFLAALVLMSLHSKKEMDTDRFAFREDFRKQESELDKKKQEIENTIQEFKQLKIEVDELAKTSEILKDANNKVINTATNIDKVIIGVKNRAENIVLPKYPEYPLSDTRKLVNDLHQDLMKYEVFEQKLDNKMRYIIGLSCFYSGEFNTALNHFNKVHDETLYLNNELMKGICYTRLSAKDDAIKQFQKVIASQTKYLRAYSYLMELHDLKFTLNEDISLLTKVKLIQNILFLIYKVKSDQDINEFKYLVNIDIELTNQLLQQFKLMNFNYGFRNYDQDLIKSIIKDIIVQDKFGYLNINTIILEHSTELKNLLSEEPDLRTFDF